MLHIAQGMHMVSEDITEKVNKETCMYDLSVMQCHVAAYL